MTEPIALFPGFPLTLADYDPLRGELALTLDQPIRLAHSLGSLDALAEESVLPLVLLAPSVPKPRPARPLVRTALALVARTGASAALSSRLRARTFARYGAEAPRGPSLSLAEAAERLRRKKVDIRAPRGRVVVLCSRSDPRHPAQLELARQLAAPVHWVDGGHLFPVTNPVGAAGAIALACRS